MTFVLIVKDHFLEGLIPKIEDKQLPGRLWFIPTNCLYQNYLQPEIRGWLKGSEPPLSLRFPWYKIRLPQPFTFLSPPTWGGAHTAR